jgi:hypothetical protein
MIGGAPYLMVDLGRDGAVRLHKRSGLVGIYGKQVILDPRYLSSYLRDASALDASQYRRLRYPRAIDAVPRDLENPDLQYSGIYEDGWLGGTSFVKLGPGPRSALTLRADALPIPHQHLTVLVNGHVVASRPITDPSLSLRLPIGPSRTPRTVVLRWARTVPLGPKDPRKAAAHLGSLGLAGGPAR